MSESLEIKNLKTRLNEVLRVFTEETGVVITDLYVDVKQTNSDVFYEVDVEELV